MELKTEDNKSITRFFEPENVLNVSGLIVINELNAIGK